MATRTLHTVVIGYLLGLLCAQSALAANVVIEQQADAVLLREGDASVRVSLQRPELVFEGVGRVAGAAPQRIDGKIETDQTVAVTYSPFALPNNGGLSVTLMLRWSPDERLLRKWAELRIDGTTQPLRLDEVTLESLPSQAVELRSNPPQSYPAFLHGAFAGIEFPVAATRIEGDRLLLQHRPGATLVSGATYTSRTEVIGITQPGNEKSAFMRYISAHRVAPTGLHINYNSWWTSSVPFSEAEIVRLIQTFEEGLTRPYGVAFDTFTIDMGWSDPKTLWGINAEMFPDGFAPLQDATRSMGSRLGLWISPSSYYPPALDNVWAGAQGYETFTTTMPLACLGGERYSAAFRERLVDMVKQYGIRHIKLDGYALQCPETGHGHAPGELSAEAVADGGIAAFDAIHSVAPDTWLEATCFGWNPSPWWLFHVNSVIGTFGDDAPRGRVPAPVYRESYTTARDFFNLQGATYIPLPAAAQEVLGVIHQTREPFLNDAVTTIMRGHGFLPLYINPAYMDARRWKDLAAVLNWARNNALVFNDSQPILPPSWRDGKAPQFSNDASMPREPYGYEHRDGNRKLVLLRNPWIAPCSVEISLALNREPATASRVNVVSLYPETRVYGRDLDATGQLNIPLAPYETVVLNVEDDLPSQELADARQSLTNVLTLTGTQSKVSRVKFDGDAETIGDNWTALVEPGSTALDLHAETHVRVNAPEARLLVLLESNEATPSAVRAVAKANGEEVELAIVSSDQGWSATGLPHTGERWVFLGGKLPAEEADLTLDILTGGGTSTASAWIWATKPGEPASTLPTALPAPETISLDAQSIVAPILATEVNVIEQRPLEIERIEGIYLDAVDPVSATVGWGTMQTNQSITETPLVIGGRTFRRGLGVHADSNVVYELEAKYSRFQAWVGPNGGSGATIMFAVRVDGEIRWESGLMTPADPPKRVDIDIRGANRLELIVGDGGNGIGADHANWADAKLLE